MKEAPVLPVVVLILDEEGEFIADVLDRCRLIAQAYQRVFVCVAMFARMCHAETVVPAAEARSHTHTLTHTHTHTHTQTHTGIRLGAHGWLWY